MRVWRTLPPALAAWAFGALPRGRCLTTPPRSLGGPRGRVSGPHAFVGCPPRRPTSTLSAVSTEDKEALAVPIDTLPSDAPPIDKEALSRLESCNSRTAAQTVLSWALYPPPSGTDDDGGDGTSQRLYDSVRIPKDLSSRPISDAELSLQTRTINSRYKIVDLIEQNGDRDIDRASLAVFCVFLFGSSSALLVQQSNGLPEIVRWLFVFALCFSPLILVGYGLAVPEELSAALISIQRTVFPSYRKRMIQHEAGHFLIGYLLGWPVKAYKANNAVRNAVEFYPLGDKDAGRTRAQALGFDVRTKGNDDDDTDVPQRMANGNGDQPYYSKEGSGGSDLQKSVFRDDDLIDVETFALAPQDDPTASWPFRGFDEETLDKLALISVAGACSEILACGNSEGGLADLLQLRRIYGAAAASKKKKKGANGSNGGDEALGTFTDDAKERRLRREDDTINGNGSGGMDEREMDNRTRFALGYAMVLLRQHLGALDALAEVMERDGTVAECVLALEECSNVSGYTLKGDYEKMRREKFRDEERGVGGWIEQTFLGGSKTIDVEDSGTIEGKGGGERKQGFQLTGDDPLYAALAVAVAFFAWASNGGLSLH